MDLTFLFIDYNSRPHRAKLVNERLESEAIERIPWPAMSPDLNPIENLWNYLRRDIVRRHPDPRDIIALKTTSLGEWRLIPQTVINNVIASMKTRYDMHVWVKGDHIQYLICKASIFFLSIPFFLNNFSLILLPFQFIPSATMYYMQSYYFFFFCIYKLQCHISFHNNL